MEKLFEKRRKKREDKILRIQAIADEDSNDFSSLYAESVVEINSQDSRERTDRELIDYKEIDAYEEEVDQSPTDTSFHTSQFSELPENNDVYFDYCQKTKNYSSSYRNSLFCQKDFLKFEPDENTDLFVF